MKVLIAAGGTAGHIIPAVRIAEELRRRDASTKLLFITTKRKQDVDIIHAKNFGLKTIYSGKLRRYFSLRNFVDPIFILVGFFQSIYIILVFRPDVIFSKGGYSSLPVVLAGRFLARKVVVHESDLRMGLANKIAAVFANRVLVSYPELNYPNIKKKKLVYTGNPIRNIVKVDKFTNDKTILFMGGSQGAKAINDAIFAILDNLLKDYYVIHLTGDDDFKRFLDKKENLSPGLFDKYKVLPKIYSEDEVSRIFSKATIVVSRAGAGSICDISFMGKPLILIPLPGHQQLNAEFLEKEDAAIVIREGALTPQLLREKVVEVIENKDLRDKLSQNIPKFSCPDAQIYITDILTSLASK